MSDSTFRLRTKLLTALATTTMATAACGGSTSQDSTGTGGAGTGGANTGGASTGGANTGGANTGGANTGGIAGAGALGGAGGAGGFGGLGGFAGGGGDGPLVKGTIQCDQCFSPTWTTCWKQGKVPVEPSAPSGNGPCPSGYSIKWDAFEPCGPNGWGLYYQQQATLVDGWCCYESGLQCPGGRPFKVDGELRVASVCTRDDWKGDLRAPPAELDPATRKALVSAWLGDGQLEHASVAAFARLTLQLMALGAPAELVTASQQASLDEVKHAQNCFALASRYGGAHFGPAALDLTGVTVTADLEQLVRTTFEEGCVGETLAAVQAAEARNLARDRAAFEVLDAIEGEESEHAELAFRILRWALSRDPSLRSVVRAELVAARTREERVELLALPAGIDADAWHHHGRLTPEELLRARARAFSEVVEPCVRALLGESDASLRVELSAVGA